MYFSESSLALKKLSSTKAWTLSRRDFITINSLEYSAIYSTVHHRENWWTIQIARKKSYCGQNWNWDRDLNNNEVIIIIILKIIKILQVWQVPIKGRTRVQKKTWTRSIDALHLKLYISLSFSLLPVKHWGWCVSLAPAAEWNDDCCCIILTAIQKRLQSNLLYPHSFHRD